MEEPKAPARHKHQSEGCRDTVLTVCSLVLHTWPVGAACGSWFKVAANNKKDAG